MKMEAVPRSRCTGRCALPQVTNFWLLTCIKVTDIICFQLVDDISLTMILEHLKLFSAAKTLVYILVILEESVTKP